jgi:hypothetical protein
LINLLVESGGMPSIDVSHPSKLSAGSAKACEWFHSHIVEMEQIEVRCLKKSFRGAWRIPPEELER